MKKPYPFQEEAITIGLERNMLLNDACGLGKTLTAIEVAMRFEKQGFPVLIVCPKSIRAQWFSEIVEQTDNKVNVGILDVDGRWRDGSMMLTKPDTMKIPKETQPTEIPPYQYVIIHYESLLKYGDILRSVQFSVIIADEAHKIKNRKAKRTIWLKQLKSYRRLALTATPMERKPSDYWSIINWLYPRGNEDAPSAYFTSYWEFSNTFETYEPKTSWRPYPKFIGPQNTDLLGSIMGPFTMARRKQDVIEDLPPRIMQRVKVVMGKNQRALYNEIASSKDIEVDLEQFKAQLLRPLPSNEEYFMVIKNTLSKIIKLQQVSSFPDLMGYRINSAKVKWLEEFISNNPDEQIVVFTKFRDSAIHLGGKYKAPVIVGGVQSPTVELMPFLQGKSQLVFGTIAMMGEGIDGLQIASTAVFLDQEWSTIKMNQSIDRIHRMNIDEPKHIIFVSSQDSIDDLVLKALDAKWSDQQLIETFLKEYAP